MIDKKTSLYCAFGLLLLFTTACKPSVKPTVLPGDYRRVVALSPSLSETLYALGLGDRIAGATAFARYPEEIKNIPKIGGYSDINIEAVYSLNPDLVLALEQQEDAVRRLRILGLTVSEFKNETIDEILDLIRTVGYLFQRTAEAEKLCNEIEAKKQRLKDRASGRPRFRVLVSVGRNMGNGKIGDVYAAGPNTLFGEIVEMAGGKNVYQGKAPYAALGREAILRLNPEIIIDLIPDMDTLQDYTKAAALAQWREFGKVDAVRNERVTINISSYICIPGPRIVMMMRDIEACIHSGR